MPRYCEVPRHRHKIKVIKNRSKDERASHQKSKSWRADQRRVVLLRQSIRGGPQKTKSSIIMRKSGVCVCVCVLFIVFLLNTIHEFTTIKLQVNFIYIVNLVSTASMCYSWNTVTYTTKLFVILPWHLFSVFFFVWFFFFCNV